MINLTGIDAELKRGPVILVYILQGNACDAMKVCFVIKAHGTNIRNDKQLGKLAHVRTEFGRKDYFHLAGK